MNENERQLLAMLDASGFDFRSTTREISQRFPPELDWGVVGSPRPRRRGRRSWE